MNSVFETGAVFLLEDRFSTTLERLTFGLGEADEKVLALQAKLDTINAAGVSKLSAEFEAAWKEIDRVNATGSERALKGFAGLSSGATAELAKIRASAVGVSDDVVAQMSKLASLSITELEGLGGAAPKLFDPIAVSAATASKSAIGSLAEINAAVTESVGRMKSIGADASAVIARQVGGSAGSILPGSGPMRPHGVGGSGGHGGIHMRGHGVSVPGGHVGFSGSGTTEAVGAFGVYELMKGALDRDMEMGNIASQYLQNGFSPDQINAAKGAAWANARSNPNASALEGLADILELNKATGNLGESIETLPAMSRMDTLLRSVKGEHYNREGQILNYAKGLEELGVTQMGKTPEERRASIEHYTKELSRTMVSSRGLFDGNALFAMTNNSGGAAGNWDERMATVVAPILGDIMKHGKLGNADYMAVRSYAGGTITSKAVEGLMNAGLVDDDLKSGKVYENKSGWHLAPNSKFAEGLNENVYDWSRRQLDVLQAHGHDTSNQKEMNEVINSIGSNKSTTMMMRALLEPRFRGQITKEMALRDHVPDDPTSIAQQNSPMLKVDAFKKSWENFETALGTGLTGPAMDTLNKLTAGLSGLGQFLEAHPSVAKVGADMTIVAGGIMGLSAAVKLLGINVGHARSEATAGAGGGAAGGKLGSVSLVAQSVSLFALADIAKQNHIFDDPARPGWQGVIEGLDPGLADRLFGKVDGSAVQALKLPSLVSPAEAAPARPSTADVTTQGLMQLNSYTGQLGEKSGALKISFDGLDKGALGVTGKLADFGTGTGSAASEVALLGLASRTTAGAMAGLLSAIGGSGGQFGGGGGGGFTNASYGGGGGQPNLSGAFGSNGPGVGHLFSASEREANIRSYAASLGINPNVAMAVAKSEGFGTFSGDRNTSFGDLQMHIGGGLGDTFRRVTGKDPSDPHNELALDRFALDQAKRGGWAPWHGAARIGVHGRYGIGDVPIAGPPPATRRTAPPSPATGRAGSMTSAMNMPPIHIHIDNKTHLDGKVVAENSLRHIFAATEHPTSVGGPDTYGFHAGPETPLNDCA